MYKDISKEVKKLGNKKRAEASEWFFKTGKGQYGENDKFAGLSVPQSRTIARRYLNANIRDIQKLLDSQIHEERLIALLILVDQYENVKEIERKNIVNFYIKNAKKVNNWDLVDLSAHKILGKFFLNKDKKVLYKLAKSSNLWEKRISIITTAWFIKNGRFNDTLRIADILIKDQHDLIHKAVGWMLREVGKKDLEILKKYLKPRYKKMPRTMLRYAIEKFPKNLYKKYLKGEI